VNLATTGAVVVQEGEILAGKYRVERVIGEGGMGVVVAAHHLHLDERVALKFLLPNAVASAEAVSRFLREARAAAKIKSQHVARVMDVGQLENGLPYMVLEYLDGRDLSAWLAEEGPLPVTQAVDFVLQACEALAEAHGLGIVHRDLKPANLFCIRRPDGQLSIKVLDFGISKVTSPGATAHDMTQTSAFLGSPLYMSPEQMKAARDVDARTDVWSLGIILFELLANSAPFNAESVTELAIKVAMEASPSLRSGRPDVPKGLEAAIHKCLEKDRTKRYRDMGELALALREFGSDQGRETAARVTSTLRRSQSVPLVSTAPVATVTSPGASTAASWEQTRRGGSRASTAAIAAASFAVVAALVLGGAYALTRPPAASPGGALPPPSVPPEPTTPPPMSAPPPPALTARPSASPAEPGRDSAPLTPASPLPGPGKAAPLPASSPLATHAAPVTPRGPAPPAKPGRPAPASHCDPPYTVNPNGTHTFKQECL
jgi:serine/threonine protein kinase